jgi:hypothetical protein
MSPVNQLKDAQLRVRNKWKVTILHWNDAVRREFESQHWEPIMRQSTVTFQEMEKMAEVLKSAKQHVK